MTAVADNLQLYVVRHGERVDNVFGSDWLDNAFVHYSTHSTKSANHSVYQRYDLNLPKQLPHRLPVRPLSDYEHDTPITELGTWQAANVGDALSGSRIQYVFCSPALRCVQTAHHIIQGIGLVPNKSDTSQSQQTNGSNHQQNGSSSPHTSSTFEGICVEPALYEWTGWLGDYQHKWLTPTQLRSNGLYVNTHHKPLSSVPEPDETQHAYYKRNGDLVDIIMKKYGRADLNRGNILIVGHMPSLDVCTYRLLTKEVAPRELSIQLGARNFLFSNYCGVATIKHHQQDDSWHVCDDQRYQQHNSENEPFSFYAGWKSQHHSKHKNKHTALPQLQSAVHHSASQRLPTLYFRRSFGFVLDQAHNTANYLVDYYKQHDNRIDNRELDQYITKEVSKIEMRIIEILPEWLEMKAYHNGYTAKHTYRCIVATNLLLGRQSGEKKPLLYELNATDRNMFSWAVLLHDLAKQVFLDEDGYIIRDSPHPFKSGIIAAQVLARYGFCHTSVDDARFKQWSDLVLSALKPIDSSTSGHHGADTTKLVHDNSKIPEILDGMQHLFGANTVALLVVKLVLLHQSIDFLPMHPPGAPLTDDEVLTVFGNDHHFIHILTLFTMVDSASYTLADMHVTRRNMQIIQGVGARYIKMMQQRLNK